MRNKHSNILHLVCLTLKLTPSYLHILSLWMLKVQLSGFESPDKLQGEKED